MNLRLMNEEGFNISPPEADVDVLLSSIHPADRFLRWEIEEVKAGMLPAMVTCAISPAVRTIPMRLRESPSRRFKKAGG